MNTSPRAVLVGLDGVPHSLLVHLMKSDCIPNMTEIFQKGRFSRMDVCIPEISSVSWTSFMTGAQAGEHGVYGFMDLEPGSYRLNFPNYACMRSATLWDELAARGKKSVVINMPSTYPARIIDGVLISGFVAIDIKQAVFPMSVLPVLQKYGYRIDIDTARARTDPEFLFRDLEETLSNRKRVVNYLWEETDWDLFIVVITGTDRLMHFLWDAYEDPSHPYHCHFLDYFRKVDAFVGEVYERFTNLNGSAQNLNAFYMLSDHGFTQIKSEVNLNAWLEENGFLRFQSAQPKMIMDIGPGSKAFSLDPSRIYINLKGKYPLGCVDPSDYEAVRSDLIQVMNALTNGAGEHVLKRVFTKEELYFGNHLDAAPDMVALSHHGYDLKGKVSGRSVFDRSGLSGMHTQDDAFFYSSTGAACPTIFHAKDILLDGF